MLLREMVTTYGQVHLGIRASSLDQVRIAVKKLDDWQGRPVEVAELNDELLRGFLAWYLSRGVSAATVNAKRRHLLGLWRCAADAGLVDRRPGKIRAAAEDLPEPEAWRLDEFERIVAAAAVEPGDVAGVPAGPWWTSLLLVDYWTAERIGALLEVTPQDFTLTGPEAFCGVNVRRRKNHRGKWHWLPEQAVEACRAIHDPARKRMWAFPWTRTWLDELFRRILTRAGVSFGRGRGGTWHKIRRTSTSLVEAHGGDGAVHGGHSRKVFTRHYCDPRICGGSQAARLPVPAIASPRVLE